MLIANPIYDVFFKYLLEDNEIAKELIGAIIDEEILELQLEPQESTVQMKEFAFTVLRMDFHAKIKTKEGSKTVLIEMQKGKYFEDLQRFRTYLGERYGKGDLPIITIYFLGYTLDPALPAVTFVKRDYYDRFTNQKLEIKNEFIEALSHNSYLIQVGLLNDSVRTKLEAILSVFDQTKKGRESYILSFPDTIPDVQILQKIIQRLQMAGTTEELRKKAQIENEIEGSFKKMAREIQEKEELLVEKDKAIEEKDKTIEERNAVIQNVVKLLKESGVALPEISKKTGLTLEEISKIV